MNWENVQINRQNIVTDSGRAVLFKCPKKSKYSGYMFWHPAKLVKRGAHIYAVKVVFSEFWDFKLFTTNKRGEVTNEIEIDADEFKACFGVMSDNIIHSTAKREEAYLEVKEPTKVESEEVKVNECLKNN